MPRHIEIPLDKMRRLHYNVNAMVELEEMFGGGLPKIFAPETIGIRSVRDLIFIGLKYGGDKRITPEDTGDLLSKYVLEPGQPLSDPLLYAMQALQRGGFIPKEMLDAFTKSLEPEKDDEDEGDEESKEGVESPPAQGEVETPEG